MRDIAFLVYPGYSVMALAVVTAFEVANSLADPNRPTTSISFLRRAERSGPRRACSWTPSPSRINRSTPWSWAARRCPPPSTPGLIAFMREASKRHRRIAAVCTGAFVLAEAGLLDGRHATTHWLHARDLQRQFPKVKMEEDRIFMTTVHLDVRRNDRGLDLSLALDRERSGAGARQVVARKLVIYHRRAGGQSQFSALLELTPNRTASRPRSTTRGKSRLAASGRRSRRRRASQPTAVQPGLPRRDRPIAGQGDRNLRVEAARTDGESRHSIDVVARETGSAIASACAGLLAGLRAAATGAPAQRAAGGARLSEFVQSRKRAHQGPVT